MIRVSFFNMLKGYGFNMINFTGFVGSLGRARCYYGV